MKIGVMDYGAGNIRSVETALRYLGADFVVSGEAEVLKACDKLVIPGDGEARAAMRVLNETGLAAFVRDFFSRGRPILGICIGCQIIMEHSEERDTECLGLIPGDVLRFPAGGGLKVPHMGWNAVAHGGSHPIFRGVQDGVPCFFVHSYYPKPQDASCAIARTDYGLEFASAVARGSLVALQFHPEKSAAPGIKMLENFARRL
ncbi:MAG: imidazole glycerol phosphate synthase subunit HisH [Spirochaetia bacterium]|jgi:glutamine amidotransferase|nr:imidazole glycerol phosphate synthase subunit HisH [Spirochaetia bacterium]